MDCNTDQFNYYLDECYFHPERDKEFSSEEEKKLARRSMETLWNKPNIIVEGTTYSNQEIRQKLIEEMMPEILDRAVEIYRKSKDIKYESAYLAACIFRTLLNYDAYVDRLFKQTYKG